jgi:hypothetical protein
MSCYRHAPFIVLSEFIVAPYFGLLHFFFAHQVAVNTVIQDEKEFLNHVIKSTNMKCLTPP